MFPITCFLRCIKKSRQVLISVKTRFPLHLFHPVIIIIFEIVVVADVVVKIVVSLVVVVIVIVVDVFPFF